MRNTNRFNLRYYRALTTAIYSRKMACCGRRSILFHPMRIDNPRSISIGDGVFIGDGAWLMGVDRGKVTLRIDSGTTIGHFSHIVAQHDVYIGQDVLIADKVFISDCTHVYSDVKIPVKHQPVAPIGSVAIGAGSWIGEGVAISGAKIGVHCVIGSNSVVNHDIPDYSVAVGAPARVVSHFDMDAKQWVKN